MQNLSPGNPYRPAADPAAGAGDAEAPPGGGKWPRISIVTPNRNMAPLIGITMRSVATQGYPDLEYLVMDNGSDDGSQDVIRRHESLVTHWETKPDRTQYEGINAGLARATGDIFAWINSDDVYFPWTLRSVATVFAQFPQVDWIIGHPCLMQDGAVHRLLRHTPYPRDLLRAGLFHGGPGGLSWIQQQSTFWRRSLWEKAGPLRTELGLAADYELNVRFARHAELYGVSTLLSGHNFRGPLSRSVTNRGRYVAEINDVVKALVAEDPSLEKVHRDVQRFNRARRYPGVRGIARRALGLSRYRGPMLRWDFETLKYGLEYVDYFNSRYGQ